MKKSIKRGSTSLPRHLYETRWPNNDSFLRRLARRQACNIFVGFWGASRTYSSQANELSACLSMAFRLNPPLSYTLLLSVSRRLLHSQSNQPSRCRAPLRRDPVAPQKRGSAVLSNRLPLVRLGWIPTKFQLGDAGANPGVQHHCQVSELRKGEGAPCCRIACLSSG